MEFDEQVLIYFMGAIGAFIWVFLSYNLMSDFSLKSRLLGERSSVIVWCALGGFVGWLFELVSNYGFHPALLCSVFAGFGWSGIFTGIYATRRQMMERRQVGRIFRDLGE